MMKKILIAFTVVIGMSSCEKFVTEEPVDLILTENAIIDAASANQAVLGVYSLLQTASFYGNNQVTFAGVLSDELQHSGSFPTIAEMDANNVTSSNVTADNPWVAGYDGIFRANVVLEILEAGTELPGLTPQVRTLHIGEARFLRALLHFLMSNYYGDIPIITGTDVEANSSVSRDPQADVYAFAISEAAQAASELDGVDWTSELLGFGDPNQWRATDFAALALRARALLYSGDAAAAAVVADDVITRGGYELEPNYADLFVPGARSNEIIFSFFFSSNDQNGLPFQFLPDGRFEYAVEDNFLAAHGSDNRALIVQNTADNQGRFYVNKYTDLANGTDNTIVFRLAEMYLIRAEGNPGTALADLNVLRTRAAMPARTTATLDDVLDERFIELSFEGHRWHDIVRTGRVEAIMATVPQSQFVPGKQILPIPQRDLEQNSNLAPQNPTY